MDQTCVDTDDDNLEFEDAQIEEEEDNIVHDVSAFMVSKANISRYAQDRTAKHVEGKPIIPNKMLDSEYLRETVDYSMKMEPDNNHPGEMNNGPGIEVRQSTDFVKTIKNSEKKLERARESHNSINEIANSN